MDKNYYIQKYEDRMMEIYNMFTDEEYCTRWFDETANAEEVVGYYFVHYEWNPLKAWFASVFLSARNRMRGLLPVLRTFHLV